MQYLRESIFIFGSIFIIINCIISWIQTFLFFFRVCLLEYVFLEYAYFLEYVLLLLDDNVDEECQYFSDIKSSASGCCLAFAWFFANISLVLLIKVLLIKKCEVKRIVEKVSSC